MRAVIVVLSIQRTTAVANCFLVGHRVFKLSVSLVAIVSNSSFVSSSSRRWPACGSGGVLKSSPAWIQSSISTHNYNNLLCGRWIGCSALARLCGWLCLFVRIAKDCNL